MSSTNRTPQTINIFYCYAREDEKMRDELAKHLATLTHVGYIVEWHDRKIVPGYQWKDEIKHHLSNADIVLLLVSPNFMASDYCYSTEMKQALERQETKEAYVIPVILYPVDWKGTPIEDLQMLPKGAKPIANWRNRNEGYQNAAQGIREIVENIHSLRNTKEYSHIAEIEPSQGTETQTFTFGTQTTSWIVVDGDGESEYTSQTLQTHLIPHTDELPEDLAEGRSQIQKQQDENRQKGLPFQWNGELYSLDKFIISRESLEELISLDLWFKLSDYYTFLATNMRLDEEHLREKYLQEVNWHSPIKFFSSSFGVNLTVITSDSYILITQRSTFVGSRPNEYNISVNEGLSKSLDRSIQGPAPDLYRCASRGLSEELGLNNPQDFQSRDITFLSFGVDTHYSQWGLLGMIKVNKTAREIQQCRTHGVKDKWENSNLHSIKCDLDVIIPFVLSHGPWAPGGLVCLYHTLVHEFQRHKVNEAIASYIYKNTKERRI